MNRVYKIVWSKAKNAYVVTSELAKNHTKNASGKMVKAALAAAMGMGVLMGGYMADAAPATNPSGDGPGIAIGTGSSSQKVDSTAVGKNAKTTGESALAVGCNNMAGADGAMAVGNDNKAMAGGSLAVGARNIAQGMGGLAIGESNTAKGDDSAAVGHSNKVHAMGTYAFGLQNTVWKMYSQAYGMNNIVSEINSFAYGNSNQVGSMNSFAFGGANLNTARWAVTVGNTNKVGGEHSFAAGFYNTIGSTSKDAVAIGQNARVGVSDFNVATTIDPTTGKITAVYNGEVDATNSVAIGHEANVMALNSVALGENTGVTKDGKNGTAIGGEASVKAENGTAAGFKATVRAKSGVALGASSFVDAEGGVALGRNSIAERKSGMAGYDFTTGAVSAVNDSTWKATDGAVSVGNSANTRQITRVAAGTEDTDAVNVAQIKGLAKKIVLTVGDVKIDNSGINAGNKKITNVAAGDISANSTDAVNGGQLWKTNQTINNIGGAVNELGTRVNRVGAGAAALAALHPLDFDPDDKWDVAAGYGNYKDAHAVSVGAFYRPNEDTMFSVGGSFGGGENMVNAGVSVKLGQGNHVSTSRVALAKEVEDLKAIVKAQSAEIKAMRGAMQSGTSVMKDVNFPDVPKDHWAYSYVKSLADRGLLEGYPDGEFKGDRSMTRYEFAAIIYRALQNGAPIDSDMAKAIGEFDPEINRIKDLDRTRVDRISGKDNDRHKVERVRVNNESNKEKGDYRDVYGSHISPEA